MKGRSEWRSSQHSLAALQTEACRETVWRHWNSFRRVEWKPIECLRGRTVYRTVRRTVRPFPISTSVGIDLDRPFVLCRSTRFWPEKNFSKEIIRQYLQYKSLPKFDVNQPSRFSWTREHIVHIDPLSTVSDSSPRQRVFVTGCTHNHRCQLALGAKSS